MTRKSLDEEKLVQMYKDGTTIKMIGRHFDVSSGLIYKRLKSNGIESDRKKSIPWTDKENEQLISARKAGLTGAELYAEIPTREPAGIKSRVQRFRRLKLIR